MLLEGVSEIFNFVQVLIPRFLRNFHAVFHSGYVSLIPINNARGFPFLLTLSSIYGLQIFFDVGHSNWRELISHCNIVLHFSNNE